MRRAGLVVEVAGLQMLGIRQRSSPQNLLAAEDAARENPNLPLLSCSVLVVVVALVAAQGSAGGGERSAGPEGIVFERKGDLYAVAVDGSRTVQLTKTRTFELHPAVSNDGRSIAYTRLARGTRYHGGTRWPDFAARGRIWTMSLDGKRRKTVTPGGDYGPAWSPGGETIFFSHDVPLGRYGVECPVIFRTQTNSRDLRRVTRLGGGQYDAAVSPDGGRIAFTWSSGCEGGTVTFALGVVDTSGRPTGDLARLPGNASFSFDTAEYSNPTWAPDGSQLAFEGVVSRGGGGSSHGVLVANLDGSGMHPVTPVGASDPAWSPDGEWIAYLSHGDVYVTHPDGTGRRRLTRTKLGAYPSRRGEENAPAWLPQMPTG
jgi:Tol biopolymer transport system component